jgi:hypothetical protein
MDRRDEAQDVCALPGGQSVVVGTRTAWMNQMAPTFNRNDLDARFDLPMFKTSWPKCVVEW